MEEIMLSDFSKMRRSRITAISFAVIGGLVILLTIYSVRPTASRFDLSVQRSTVGLVTPTAPGTPAGETLQEESFFDYSLIFPEQPSPAVP
jgi:hypothetical protein